MLGDLLPEILSIIASHLPLYIYPSTLLALGLTNRRLNGVVVPYLLYRHICLKGKKCALPVLVKQADADRPPLGHFTRQLFISTEPADARDGRVDIIGQLSALIDVGGLPNLISLTLHMSGNGNLGLDASFWCSL